MRREVPLACVNVSDLGGPDDLSFMRSPPIDLLSKVIPFGGSAAKPFVANIRESALGVPELSKFLTVLWQIMSSGVLIAP